MWSRNCNRARCPRHRKQHGDEFHQLTRFISSHATAGSFTDWSPPPNARRAHVHSLDVSTYHAQGCVAPKTGRSAGRLGGRMCTGSFAHVCAGVRQLCFTMSTNSWCLHMQHHAYKFCSRDAQGNEIAARHSMTRCKRRAAQVDRQRTTACPQSARGGTRSQACCPALRRRRLSLPRGAAGLQPAACTLRAP